MAVFFDLEKAYDTTWMYGIQRDLHDLGVRGRLATFIDSFLTDPGSSWVDFTRTI